MKAQFNVAAHHPLNTVGGPRQSAAHPDDVVMPDMHALAQVVRVAERRRLVRGGRRHPLWATEFWWETDPPDPGGVRAQVQARWIEEAFFVLFKQRVRVALMIGLADAPLVGVAGSDGAAERSLLRRRRPQALTAGGSVPVRRLRCRKGSRGSMADRAGDGGACV